jgi:FixJ family two-component response regulator
VFPGETLTRQQRAVADRIRRGCSKRGIRRALGISRRSVDRLARKASLRRLGAVFNLPAGPYGSIG